ncbi:MAG: hypothetical protein L5656_09180 [Thermanaeromonas sp.]|uniref:DUF1641 domain-containing protein n=1 Tax=Thermanaeromonas sp. TaxID=2003697 RepID=UPI002437E100|nr:hypothetical protein [Thermanaeromonas sp.]MCG0278683.1 hypothetical protein [Thermanaeromonas sp.]
MAQGVAYNLNHPETSRLVQELQKLNHNLESFLKELERLQATGLVDTLINLGVVVQAAKDSLTPGVITHVFSQLVNILSLLDHIQSLGGSQFIAATVQAFEEAVQENKGKQAKSLWTLLRLLKKDPQVKKSLEILVSFLQKFSTNLNFAQAK